MKKLIVIFTLLATTVTFAQDKNAKATLEVDGICGMCKKRIETATIKTKGVKFADWDIVSKQLSIIYDERKTNLEIINKNIAAVGHDTKEVKATDEAYNSVHPCCLYRDPDVIGEHKKEN
ncbi:heavy-metal-associated domain-containing protein [Patiriisocius hiemis]|uniref:Heavy-metal-associated domain-containing protein n=1 Tax=Patiriisocius hiemis TaxID=3075604 RepID=A0ABU2YG84_9FLAO|nr:heavy-metal-associated domain-containing protein [Constantimarinum sp. W242]MDT0556240.1 heavy-metal-associated domain-containing protein [Constantimarinum sp. W242]